MKFSKIINRFPSDTSNGLKYICFLYYLVGFDSLKSIASGINDKFLRS